ncbi:hypothetical protein PhCBS80983_g03074 [Powellomyces hirtus]|uniref:Etoposide-induced protein 2.4 (EI24) n=1 Tax=Powellomyces hirtus TaxID=109895 RepID=A0A507E3U2_9FUNG|nr:hypothetical protein PhCBS80983_g03074 [Powellomyces hirtus]
MDPPPLRSSLRKTGQSKTPTASSPDLSPRAGQRNADTGSSGEALKDGPAKQATGSPATLSEALAFHGRCGYQGVKDAFALPAALIAIYGSKTIQVNTFKCFLLNGLIFLGSIFVFDYAILPISRLLRSYAGIHPSPKDHTSDLFDTLFSMTYSILWVYPIYVLSFILNAIWYQRIADRSYRVQVGKPVSTPFTYERLVKTLTDEAYRGLLLFNFLIQSLAIYFLPYAGPPLSFICFCWTASFYSFEYRWANKGWSLQQRVDHFESHWAYYIGFGLPVTALTFFFPQFISQGLFALLFPMYIIMSNRAHPIPKQGQNIKSRFVPQRLPIFRFAVRANMCCIRTIVARTRSASAKR